jgi:hypothetical protein
MKTHRQLFSTSYKKRDRCRNTLIR